VNLDLQYSPDLFSLSKIVKKVFLIKIIAVFIQNLN
jgi:hypothetical protein